ncbi:DUF4256 domain-containing protein [Pedobacter mucosus]|uniref:DUF4256 domain-containing protein n=1 Tax=Pedobacter mucosus TaxID=2895286 RepID=UPI001EE441B9|nr:DUF4256 domain-containing protein [Pedobacter mucosus]UKT64079.1 DUF4256 domain-containing protein [Pedobacter mucosus]
MNKKELSTQQNEDLLLVLRTRFENNLHRHKTIEWLNVKAKLEGNPEKCWSLNEMEITGGEPDIIEYDKSTDEFIFYDCAMESPKGRRSCCYDNEALVARKENKPKNSAIETAASMGIKILSESQYRVLQQYGNFDTKTSSWIETPGDIRKLGGALFADFRYNNIFVYHNGAESYYAARGFRGLLRV